MAACTIEVTFNPLGDELSVEGAWLINGVPADATTCGAAGIDEVQVVFIDGGVDYRFDQFTFPCAQGSFNTAPTLVLDRGVYTTEWRAYDALGVETHRGGALGLDTSLQAIGGHVILATADFVATAAGPSLGVNLGYETVGGLEGQDCATAGVDTISYMLADSTGTTVDDMTDIACGTRIDWTEIAADTYSLYIEGTSATGTKDWMATCTGLIVGTGAADWDCVVPWASTDNILVVNLGWDTDPSAAGMAYDTCAAAGVADFSYQLTDEGTGTNYAEETDIACGEQAVWRGVPAATYRLYAEGGNAAGVKNWMGTCSGMTVTDGARVIFDCNYDDASGG